MSQTLEAEAAFIHVAGGAPRITSPPGTLARTAPRRAARGRSEDVLFLSLGLHSPEPLSPGLLDYLAQLASEAYYGTPRSVTSALREAAVEVNDYLLDINQDQSRSTRVEGRLIIAVLRGKDLFLAQSGMGQAILARPGQVSRFASEEAANRPLGLTHEPHVRYYHLELQPNDSLILTTWPPPVWSDPSLAGVVGLGTAMAVDRLTAASPYDLTGLLLRFTLAQEATPARLRPTSEVEAPSRTPSVPAAVRPPLEAARMPEQVTAEPPRLARGLRAAFTAIRRAFASMGYGFAKIVTRMAPGIAEAPRPGTYPPVLLAVTAITVPLVVVAVASVVYFRQGRGEQFLQYLSQAEAAVASAQRQPDLEAGRTEWELAWQWLELAESYGTSEASQALRQHVLQALDNLDMVVRLDFRPTVGGGFGSDAKLTALAVTGPDLYVLDETNQKIWHAWSTGRGYDIDLDFDCLDGPGSVPRMNIPVDIAIQAEPGALGAEGVVAIDDDGTILYCAPDKRPASSQLAPPDIGWGHIQAIDLTNNALLALDPEMNAVWIYDASGGLFSGTPALYFAEQVRDLSEAIDIAMAQDELFILFSDGHLDRCVRRTENAPSGGIRIRVECDEDTRFQDTRPDHLPTTYIPGAVPSEIVYSPPPEPSIFLLDSLTGTVFHYSMRLVYQAQYRAIEALEGDPTALAIGHANEFFVASGDQVYHAQLLR